jgi:hypothetical protein
VLALHNHAALILAAASEALLKSRRVSVFLIATVPVARALEV